MPELDALLPQVDTLVGQAALAALAHRPSATASIKPDGSIVTTADTLVEGLLREALTRLLPGSAFWGEEGDFAGPGPEGLWLVDPIDGTSNFTYGQPLWGITVGLWREGGLCLGVTHLPDLGERLTARAGGGAFLNGDRLAPLAAGRILDHEVVGHGEGGQLHFPSLPGKVRHLGSFVVEAVFVATQRLRAMSSTRCRLYDAAGTLVALKELGAQIVHGDGKDMNPSAWLRNEQVDPYLVLPPDSGVLEGLGELG